MLDFFNNLRGLQNQGSTDLPINDLDPTFLITLLSDQTKTKDFFDSTLDQISFSSDDYKKLKNFIVDWYSSLKAIGTVQKNASMIYSLPEDHLNELIKSFGFEVQTLLRMPKQNKINLFFDLVNLYKIKGTPEAIGRILQYYNIPNLEVLEYWMEYDSSKNLVLRPSVVYSSNTTGRDIPIEIINFEPIRELDPHWFLTKEQIDNKFITKKLSFPSKTPYLGIRPILEQSGKGQFLVSSIISRYICDEYNTWVSTQVLPTDFTISYLGNVNVSLLEAYLSYIYIFNLYYQRSTGSSGLSYDCYDGISMPLITIPDVISEADSLIKRPSSRSDRKIRYQEVKNLFTKLMSDNFLTSYNTAGIKLKLINSSLKNLIDNQFNINKSEDVLIAILLDISYWVSDHIDSTYPNLANLVFGFSTSNYIIDKINFFKPYRARLISSDSVYLIDNPLENSIEVEDSFFTTIIESAFDWDTADSKPGYLEDFQPMGNSVTSTPPIQADKQILDIYIDQAGLVKATYTDTPTYPSVKVTSTPPIGCYRISDIFIEIGDGIFYDLGTKQIRVQYSDVPETIGGISSYVLSNPTTNCFYVNDIYYNSLNQFTIIYDSNPLVWPIDSTARIYYSRNLMDTGSYFDIGASSDSPPIDDPDIYITDHYYDIYNYHTSDSTSIVSVEYTTDSTSGEIIEILTDGGWNEFDDGLFFDSPVFNDVCTIRVTQV
jgi:hypothetical protein